MAPKPGILIEAESGIKESALRSGRYGKRANEVAARTVMNLFKAHAAYRAFFALRKLLFDPNV